MTEASSIHLRSDGRKVHYGYDTGTDAAISRLSFLADDSGRINRDGR